MVYTFKKLQVLNITTGILHTKMDDIYIFFEQLTDQVLMTHDLPNAAKAIKTILERQLPDEYFKEVYSPDIDNINVDIKITEDDKKEFRQSFYNMP